MKMRTGMPVIVACGAIILAGTGCAGAGGAQVKTYHEGLQVRIGQDEKPVAETIVREWGFSILQKWEAVDPDTETVLKNNPRFHGFTRGQAGEVFAERGSYRVLILLKPLGEEKIRMSSIDQMGLTVPESMQTATGRDSIYIRLIFRDGKLVHYSIWT